MSPTFLCYVVCDSSRYNARSDWLILGRYSPVLPTGRLQASTPKQKAKGRIINHLLTSKVRSLRENLKPLPCRIVSLGQ